MEPDTITWATAIFAGSVAAKLAGLIFISAKISQVRGPILGIISGLIVWQGASALGWADPLNYYHAGGFSFAGGIVGYTIYALLKKRRNLA